MQRGWDAFVGRAAELDVLDAALHRAEAGAGSIVLVAGEPGIGKSSLIDHFATTARLRGARVVWGRCWEAGGAPAYWPFVQAMRTIARDVGIETVRVWTESYGSELAQLLPEVRTPLRESTPSAVLDPDTARFELFDAVASFLRAAASDSPLVVALDDVHGADTPSLLLLEFLARELRDARIALVVSYRSTEVTPDHALAATLAELSRVPTARRLTLEGFAPGEISEYIARVTGGEAESAVVDALEERTEGNPLFVSEIVRIMLGDARSERAPVRLPDEIPDGVQEAITRRVATLSAECRETLDTAAILGRDVPLEVLTALTEDADVLLDALDEAVAAGILTRVPGATGDLRFSHVLVRDALYDRLPTATRGRAHLRAAAVIETLRASDLGAHRSEIAHHHIAAGPVADTAIAANHAALAGQAALETLAHEEAIRWFSTALELIERAGADDATRLDLLLPLGEAELRAGDLSSAHATFRSAAEFARRLHRADALARAALGYGGRFAWVRAGADTVLVELLTDALEAIGPTDSSLRAQLLSRIAGARRSEPDPGLRRAEAAEAVAIARRLDDPRALSRAFDGYHGAIWDPDSVEERLALADEMLACATLSHDTEEMVVAHCARWVARWESGDFAGARADIAAAVPVATRLRQPAQRWLIAIAQGAVALFEGRFADVEAHARTGRFEGRGSLEFDADAAYLTQLGLLVAEQGRVADFHDELERGAEAYPWYPHLRALLARLLAFDGQLDRARTIVESCAPDNYAVSPTSSNYNMFTLALLADVVGELNDPDLAAPLLDRMRPYAHLTALAPPEASVGSLARPIAVLHGVLGQFDDAERSFEVALRTHREMGAQPWEAHTHHQYAQMLRTHDVVDEERIGKHMARAIEIAERLSMTNLTARARSGGPPEATSEDAFVREGEIWTLSYRGRCVRMKHSKGLVYIAALLALPNREIPALALAALGDGAGAAVDQAVYMAGGDGGAVLDAHARQSYRRRIEDLQEEIDEAEKWSDVERTGRARTELDFLTHELAAATGFGGRDRALGSNADRARQRVKKAITASLARISAEHAELGRHLTSTVRTGYSCRYEPDPRVPTEWRL